METITFSLDVSQKDLDTVTLLDLGFVLLSSPKGQTQKYWGCERK